MDNSFDSLLNASAVPQDEKVQAFIAESKNNRNRCYELSEQVTAQVATDGKMLQKYLDVQSTFDRYTTNPEYCRELPQVSKKETNHER